MSTPDRFERLRGRLDVESLQKRRVVLVGVGAVGSPIAAELVKSGLGELLMIDGDVLEYANLPRHELTQEYVGENKAVALAISLASQTSTARISAVGRYVDSSVRDSDIDSWLQNADLVIAATDDRTAQRRVAERALANDKPALFPALYPDGGGEVFVQLRPGLPCFYCWEGFRGDGESLRAVQAPNVETLSIVGLSVHLSFGVLDSSSEYADVMRPTRRGDPIRQLFVQLPQAELQTPEVEKRRDCPACDIGPAQRGQHPGAGDSAAGRSDQQGRVFQDFLERSFTLAEHETRRTGCFTAFLLWVASTFGVFALGDAVFHDVEHNPAGVAFVLIGYTAVAIALLWATRTRRGLNATIVSFVVVGVVVGLVMVVRMNHLDQPPRDSLEVRPERIHRPISLTSFRRCVGGWSVHSRAPVIADRDAAPVLNMAIDNGGWLDVRLGRSGSVVEAVVLPKLSARSEDVQPLNLVDQHEGREHDRQSHFFFSAANIWVIVRPAHSAEGLSKARDKLDKALFEPCVGEPSVTAVFVDLG